MRFLLAIFFLFGGAATSKPLQSAAGALQDVGVKQDVGAVVRVRLSNEPITPVTAHFIRRALEEAEQQEAQCLVIELDTPGGLLDSTQQMVIDVLASRVPVVVYVSPSGARAASAGLFITLSSHVAAMAPGTRIGAAHPVQIGGSPIPPHETPASPHSETPAIDEPDNKSKASRSPMEDKLVNDTMAWARSLAEMRNRNTEWVVLAVSESRSITASEAVREGVVEIEAADLSDLLQQLDEREVTLQPSAGAQETVRLRTSDARIRTIEMWWGERVLAVLANPNIALVLMMLGVYGILYELYNPGWGVGGTLGVVCLVLAFFALSALPINYAGLALIAVALSLFVAEAFVVSYGALAVSGIVCLILGGTMLVDSPTGFMRVSLTLLIPISVATGLITAFLIASVVKAQRRRILTGGEGMLGMPAVARVDFLTNEDEYTGQVFVQGEIWTARSNRPVASGQAVRVQSRQGLTLLVENDADEETT